MEDTRNLLHETEDALESIGCKPEDVIQIQDASNTCSWEKFAELANKEYDAGYGVPCVRLSVRIMLKDGSWLEREEYDGKEWWLHCRPPVLLPSNDKLEDIFFDWSTEPEHNNDNSTKE